MKCLNCEKVIPIVVKNGITYYKDWTGLLMTQNQADSIDVFCSFNCERDYAEKRDLQKAKKSYEEWMSDENGSH